ncbi:NAD(P)-dependent oxidoreductase [Streptomyces boncukensis]|uniref:NAD(P)H-binding protein n=1 Tax=Streptomyces boncukensis TaxID=2711219 RepID=A0A6G4WNV1_9ACTN|nr:NAD(P)H-binding protein [Streptomyces boncukensis]NGO66939.1 NAD(P)H-binding protein [Streptomyces boncukensis]
MRLTVFGASGGTGQQVVRQALDAGHEVTAVVRNPDRLPVRHERLEVVTAELADPEPLRAAVAGRDAALSGLGAPTNKAAGIASRGTRTILRALEAEGVRRYVAVSAPPAGPVPEGESLLFRAVMWPLIGRVFKDIYADLRLMEREIRASATDWTLVHPPQLKDGPPTGAYQKRIGGAVPRSHTVVRADVAHLMLALLDDPATVHQVVGVAAGRRSRTRPGPETGPEPGPGTATARSRR